MDNEGFIRRDSGANMERGVSNMVKDSNSLQAYITETYQSMSRTNKKMAMHILEYPFKIATMSLEEFAEATDCSRSSVIRFCKHLGLSGYRELQQVCLTPRRLFTEEHGNLEWCYRVSEVSIQQTFQNLDTNEFMEVIRRCAKAPQVIWYGLGESGFLAEMGNHKCRYLGINSYCYQDESSIVGTDLLMKPDDVLIVISQSGEGHYFHQPLAIARSKGLFVVAITSKRFSWLASQADITLFAYSKAASYNRWLAVIKAGFEALISTLVLRIAEERGTELEYEGDEL